MILPPPPFINPNFMFIKKAIIVACLFIHLIGQSQSKTTQIYFSGANSYWIDLDKICTPEAANCYGSLSQYANLSAIHPNNFIVFIENIYKNDSIGNLFECTKKAVSPQHNFTKFGTKYQLNVFNLTFDYLGGYYIGGVDPTKPSQFVLARISSLFDSNATDEILFTDENDRPRDVLIIKNKLYITREFEKNKLYTYDVVSKKVDTVLLTEPIHHMTADYISCDSIVVYAFGAAETPNGNYRYWNTYRGDEFELFDSFFVYKYDYVNNVLSDKCLVDLRPIKKYLFTPYFTATTTTEFLASDPECDLLIDLDKNNSSGVLPYDYQQNKVICNDLEAPITDDDVFISTSNPIDSIVLTITGSANLEFESLIMENVGDFSFQKINDSTYILKGILNRADELYMNALKNIRYVYSGLESTELIKRTINVQAFNAAKKSEIVKAFVILQKSKKGIDTTLSICRPYVNDDMVNILQSNAGGVWSPSFMSGGNKFDSEVDRNDLYVYVTTDSICGNDTSILRIVRGGNRNLGLNDEEKICKRDSLEVTLNANPTDVILWEDGSNAQKRTLKPPGKYRVSLKTAEGCVFQDSVNVLPLYNFITTTQVLCPGDSFYFKGQNYGLGAYLLDTIVSSPICDTINRINIAEILQFSIFSSKAICNGEKYLHTDGIMYGAGEQYVDFIKSTDGRCDTINYVTLEEIPKPNPTISGDTLICFGSKTDLTASNHNKYEWNTGEMTKTIEVGGGSFDVTVIDTLDCSANETILVVEKPEWIIDLIENIEIEDGSAYEIILTGDVGRIEVLSINPEGTVNYTRDGDYLNLSTEKEGLYQLIFKDNIGCLLTKDLFIRVKKDKGNIAPNIFQINASLPENRIWKITLDQDEVFKSMSIFDRWGNVVFSSQDGPEWAGNAKSGEKVISGVYVYLVEVEDKKGNQSIMSGEVLVIE